MSFDTIELQAPLDVFPGFDDCFLRIYKHFTVAGFFSVAQIQSGDTSFVTLVTKHSSDGSLYQTKDETLDAFALFKKLYLSLHTPIQQLRKADFKRCIKEPEKTKQLLNSHLEFALKRSTISFLRKNAPISRMRTTSQGNFFFILRFEFLLASETDFFEAFFQGHKNITTLINCFIQNRPLDQNFFVSLGDLMRKIQPDFAKNSSFSLIPWGSPERLKTYFADYLLFCYYNSSEYKLRSIFSKTN